MIALEIRNLSVRYRENLVLDRASLSVETGRLVAVVGPNGAGKSTLLKAILGLVPVTTGKILAFGADLRLPDRRLAYVPQRESVDWQFPISVAEVVQMGTYGSLPWWRRLGPSQRNASRAALDAVGLADLAGRQIGQLSGGQQQRVFLARALAQGADLTFMDEPFAGVDAASEETILRILQTQRSAGKTVIVVHHDLSTVRDMFDDVILMNRTVQATGPVHQVMTPENLARAYGAGYQLATA